MPAGSILVADDDAAIRTVLNQALSRAGYEVRSTGNAATLWRWVSQGDGDLIITDVLLPDESAFDLLPRIKAIHKQKLSRPEPGKNEAYQHLEHALASKSIDWELIRQQYDQMIKYATALRLGTAQTESILRRFTKNNVQHPTYKAFAQLGRAVKTIFLCRYLRHEAFRREIHEGLNVVESWNSANGFVFFGKGGEIATNRIEEQEISVLGVASSPGVAGICEHADDAIGSGRAEMVGPADAGGLSRAHAADLRPRQSLRPFRPRSEQPDRFRPAGGVIAGASSVTFGRTLA